uniref:Uncharacterized protein n=1 Tax=Rhizophora mucronata TaxID=61149 RepID=A0A2P2QMP2_RHIMU
MPEFLMAFSLKQLLFWYSMILLSCYLL